MKFEYPYGWKSVTKCRQRHVRVRHRQHLRRHLQLRRLCGIEHCEFYDTSPEATRRFIRTFNYEQTAEFLFTKPH